MKQVGLQLLGAVFVFLVNALMTSFIFFVIRFVLRVPLRYEGDCLLYGDDEIHGEGGYALVPRRRNRLRDGPATEPTGGPQSGAGAGQDHVPNGP